jgi:deferrochelatase/peroxidase EfeB
VPTTSIDPKDVQGLVRFGYGRLKEACYLLLRIRDAGAARAWCSQAPVSTAEFQQRPPDVALQVAFTYPGLRTLGLPPDVLAGFSAEFQAGVAEDENRSRRLGDIGPSAPADWWWGGAGDIPDLVVMLFALPGQLESFRKRTQDAAWDAAFELLHCLDTSDLGGHEPFGFQDGISQPEFNWDGVPKGGSEQLTFSNLVAPGEFLLGYPNEYDKITDRPLADAADPHAANLPACATTGGKQDVGLNGTYLVMRTIEQDVRGFWQFMARQAGSDDGASRRLAETMVGRTIEGEPLASLSKAPIAGIAPGPNHFAFDQDPAGTQCPFGAHIRRANPRNTDFPDRPSGLLSRIWAKLGGATSGFRTDIMATARFHRILRRGREFGAPLSPEQAIQPAVPGEAKRGLHFLCLNANISRQFEFVQNAWLMSTKFDGLSEESDPLLGNRTPLGNVTADNFTIPREGAVRDCISGLPRFVTVRGGAYFFLPGIRALRYFGLVGK